MNSRRVHVLEILQRSWQRGACSQSERQSAKFRTDLPPCMESGAMATDTAADNDDIVIEFAVGHAERRHSSRRARGVAEDGVTAESGSRRANLARGREGRGAESEGNRGGGEGIRGEGECREHQGDALDHGEPQHRNEGKPVVG
eukprot:651996-Rhodomonas_salina.3